MTPLTDDSWPEIELIDPDTRLDLTPAHGRYAAAKPTFDYLLALALLVPALPLIGLCWLLVRATSRGPGFYTQTRVGRGGRTYRIVKLRTMRHNCEAVSGVRWALRRDERVTRVGKFLRATHLDELPQLFNVLRGEMSLVGPRPERPEVIRGQGLAEQVPGYDLRLVVSPGVTGLAQVQLPADRDLNTVRHKVAYDLYYVVHRSLWLDVRIMAATLLKAAGVGPRSIRRLFLLPSRRVVSEAFQAGLTPPVEMMSSSRLLPA